MYIDGEKITNDEYIAFRNKVAGMYRYQDDSPKKNDDFWYAGIPAQEPEDFTVTINY